MIVTLLDIRQMFGMHCDELDGVSDREWIRLIIYKSDSEGWFGVQKLY